MTDTFSGTNRRMPALTCSTEFHHFLTGEMGPCATCFPQCGPERQIERMIQRLFTKAIR
jgi:hypothetical protein